MNTNLHELEMRTVYTGKLAELAAANPDIVVLDADLSKASGTNPAFCTAFPDRFINCGVAEADMIGIAAGLAVEGRIPFCATFTPFASRRVYDQLTISVAYANTNVKIVGTAPGITAGSNGGTHMCFQDLAIMRVMPKFAARAAQELAEEGLAVDLLNCPCIKPFDAESLTASAERTGAVVTVENQSIHTGPDPRTKDWPPGVYQQICTPEEWVRNWKVGQWNHARIRCVGKYPQITTWLNGLQICLFNGESSPLPGYDKERVHALLGTEGSIGLQVHGGKKAWPNGTKCRWRNIEIRRL